MYTLVYISAEQLMKARKTAKLSPVGMGAKRMYRRLTLPPHLTTAVPGWGQARAACWPAKPDFKLVMCDHTAMDSQKVWMQLHPDLLIHICAMGLLAPRNISSWELLHSK